MAAEFPVPESFWTEFVPRYWGKAPAVFRQPFSEHMATPPEAFAALLDARDRMLQGDMRVPVRVYSEGAQIAANLVRYAPDASDGSIPGYLKRLGAQQPGDRRFGVVVNNIQAAHLGLWDRVRQFLEGLYQHVGVSPGGALVDLFFGNYAQSFFGLHKDSQEIFTFVVEGRKRMLVWPFEDFLHHPGVTEALRYRDFPLDDSFLDEEMRKKAIVLEGGPGDVFYWPSTCWHIAESDGTPVTTLSLGLFLQGEPSQALSGAAAQALREHLRGSAAWGEASSRALRGQEGDLHRTTEQVVSAAAAAFEAEGARRALRRALTERWLNWRTACGFSVVPGPVDAASLEDGARVVRVNPTHPLTWAPTGAGELVISANGLSVTGPEEPGLVRMLERLARQGRAPVSELLEDFPGARELLQALLGIRALVLA